jgi:hypothetical protein
MLYPTLLTGVLSLLLFTVGDVSASTQPANPSSVADPSLDHSLVVDVSELAEVEASRNPFPSQAMAEAFADYLRWTKSQGLSRLAAFKAMQHPAYAQGFQLPDARMAAQFAAYREWTETQGLSPYYAFRVTNFD